MRSLSVFSAAGVAAAPGSVKFSTITLSGIPVHAALFDIPKPAFDPLDEKNKTRVLIRVRAFSCNYRDQSLIFASTCREQAAYYVIGSEFSGDVVAVGPEVHNFSPGDRVLS